MDFELFNLWKDGVTPDNEEYWTKWVKNLDNKITPKQCSLLIHLIHTRIIPEDDLGKLFRARLAFWVEEDLTFYTERPDVIPWDYEDILETFTRLVDHPDKTDYYDGYVDGWNNGKSLQLYLDSI